MILYQDANQLHIWTTRLFYNRRETSLSAQVLFNTLSRQAADAQRAVVCYEEALDELLGNNRQPFSAVPRVELTGQIAHLLRPHPDPWGEATLPGGGMIHGGSLSTGPTRRGATQSSSSADRAENERITAAVAAEAKNDVADCKTQ